jgi:hypothetical protein
LRGEVCGFVFHAHEVRQQMREAGVELFGGDGRCSEAHMRAQALRRALAAELVGAHPEGVARHALQPFHQAGEQAQVVVDCVDDARMPGAALPLGLGLADPGAHEQRKAKHQQHQKPLGQDGRNMRCDQDQYLHAPPSFPRLRPGRLLLCRRAVWGGGSLRRNLWGVCCVGFGAGRWFYGRRFLRRAELCCEDEA